MGSAQGELFVSGLWNCCTRHTRPRFGGVREEGTRSGGAGGSRNYSAALSWCETALATCAENLGPKVLGTRTAALTDLGFPAPQHQHLSSRCWRNLRMPTWGKGPK